jgi:hypothetical protein
MVQVFTEAQTVNRPPHEHWPTAKRRVSNLMVFVPIQDHFIPSFGHSVAFRASFCCIALLTEPPAEVKPALTEQRLIGR